MKRYTEIDQVLKDVDNGIIIYSGSANYKIIKKGFSYYIKASTGFMINLFDEEGNLNEDLHKFFSIWYMLEETIKNKEQNLRLLMETLRSELNQKRLKFNSNKND